MPSVNLQVKSVEMEVDEPFGSRPEHHQVFECVAQTQILAVGSRNATKAPQDAVAFAANHLTGLQAYVVCDGASTTTTTDLVVRSFARDLAWRISTALISAADQADPTGDQLSSRVLDTIGLMTGADNLDYQGAAAVAGGFVFLPRAAKLWMFALGNIGLVCYWRNFRDASLRTFSLFGDSSLLRHGDDRPPSMKVICETVDGPGQLRIVVATDGTLLETAKRNHDEILRRAVMHMPDALLDLLIPASPADDATMILAALDT